MKLNKILILQTAFLGDVLLTTGLIRAVAQCYDHADIYILTIPQTADVFKYNPHVHQVITFDKRNKFSKYRAFFKLIKNIRHLQFDAAISVQGSMTSSLLMYLTGIPVRIGFDRQKLLTHPVRLQRGKHAIHRHLDLIRPLSDQTFDPDTEIFTSQKEETKADDLISRYGGNGVKRIGIAPGSIHNTKRWPRANYAELIKRLSAYPFAFFLIGGPDDRDLCEHIKLHADGNAENVAGRLSILESAALISRLDLIISNDSGPLHIANAEQTTVFAIFGPTVREFGFYPYREKDRVIEVDLYCRPCAKHGSKKCPEKHFKCMRTITPQRVADEVLSFFETGSPSGVAD